MAGIHQAELLAPAGSYESMTAAICAGADAVYLGGQLFGARAYAQNLDTEQLKRAIDYVHLHRRSLYLTVNTLLKEKELEEKLYHYIKPLYEQGLDAVIVQDMGVFALIREYFPDLPIHASTQMTVTGAYGARMLKEMGAKRVVLAREVSLKEIAGIKDQVEIELEGFIHGALCYCYSGQCLFSSIAGGRSGNRGRCAQPCRLPYTCEGKQQYFLSPRDLCTIQMLPDLIEAGIYSLKIEGRMKKPEYTAGVVSIYRKYLDNYLLNGKGYRYQVKEEDKRALFDIYNRGSFTEGYYNKYNGKDMIFLKGREGEEPRKTEELFNQIQKAYIETEKKELISGAVIIKSGQPAIIIIKSEERQIQLEGAPVMEAEKHPLDKEKIRKQIEKLGNTPFEWKDLTVETDNKSFLPVTALNELRRMAIEKLSEEIVLPYKRVTRPMKGRIIETEESPIFSYRLHVYLEKQEYVDTFLGMEGIDALYLDSCVFDLKELKQIVEKNKKKKELIYVLPHIFRKKEAEWLDAIYEKLYSSGIDGFLVKNYEELQYLKEKGCSLPVRCDYTIYTYNNRTKQFLKEYNQAEWFTLPVELKKGELQGLARGFSELLAYGRVPMMVSAQCLQKNRKNCTKKAGTLTLLDRYSNEFPVKNQCKFCYNKIYNCKPLSLLSKKEEVKEIAPSAIRLDFTTETVKEAKEITRCFVDAYKEGVIYEKEPWDFTRGHFNRGIE